MEKVIFLFFGNNIDTCCRKVLVLNLSLSTITSKIFLMILILFIHLIGEKLLLPIKCVSREGTSGLILSKIIIIFFYWLVALEILDINLLYARGQLQQCFCFCINSFFNCLISGVQFFALGIYLSLDGGLQAFLEVSNQDIFIKNCNGIKFL